MERQLSCRVSSNTNRLPSQRPPHPKRPQGIARREPQFTINTVLAQERENHARVIYARPAWYLQHAEVSRRNRRTCILCFGQAERRLHGTTRWPGSKEEGTDHVVGQGDAAPSSGGGEREGHLSDEVCGGVLGERDAECELGFCAEETLELDAGCWIGEGRGDLR